ncbi:hypothetical protein CE91St41_16570 [Oscillospiraceae bacterium]|nr:hypothetical protein CE91St40_20970 [Oscillospiraceae bacterium]BDF74768.1 hypothetical protein CE91St41_16570 [Oscillospiraceae bacterium]
MFHLNRYMERSVSDMPVIPLPNPGEGGPVAPGPGGSNVPVIPLPNPGEGGPVGGMDDMPVIPLPNPGEGGPVAPGPGGSNIPVIPLPNPGEGGPVAPSWPSYASVRFLNAAFGYQPFRILINNVRRVNFLSFSSVSAYGRVSTGYQTVTVMGADGYIYIQKSIPFQAGSISTVAVINRAGGLDLLQISDTCCTPGGGFSNFRVSNLAYNSRPMDVLLADGRVIYADVRFKETTIYKRIRPGAYEFLFAETNQLPMPAYADIESLDSAFIGMYPVPNTVASLYLNVRRNANYTAFIVNNGTATNAVQIMVVEDR